MNEPNCRRFTPRRTGRSFVSRLALTAMLVAVGLAASAGTASSAEPTAEALLDQYIEAMGGKEAFEKVDNRVIRGKLVVAAQGVEMNLTMYSARPNLSYMLIESEMTGKIEKGSDGEVYWENSAMAGAQVKEGQERTDYLRESVFDKWLYWRELYPEVEYAGSETLAEIPVHKVVVTPEDGKPQTLFLDQESNLAVRVDMVVETPMGIFPVISYMSDYREIDGILIPHMMEVEIMGQKREVLTESVEHNVELPADRFALPTEIRSILEQQAGDAAAEVESTNE